MNAYPDFDNHASCSDSLTPDIWFPEEISGTGGRGWSYTQDAKLARQICFGCPAINECAEYSLQFRDLTGIWAGLDRFQRAAIQKTERLKTISVSSTIAPFAAALPRGAHGVRQE